MNKRNKIIAYNPVLRARARELRRNGTKGEAMLWTALKKRALGCEFHRQVPIDWYIVDFFCHEKMLAIEVDGSSHAHPETGANDVVRRERLEGMGIKVIRFAEADVRRNLHWVVETIRGVVDEQEQECGQGHPPPLRGTPFKGGQIRHPPPLRGTPFKGGQIRHPPPLRGTPFKGGQEYLVMSFQCLAGESVNAKS